MLKEFFSLHSDRRVYTQSPRWVLMTLLHIEHKIDITRISKSMSMCIVSHAPTVHVDCGDVMLLILNLVKYCVIHHLDLTTRVSLSNKRLIKQISK